MKQKFHILASPCIVLSKYNNVASHISKIALLILTCNIKYIILYSIAIKFRLKWTHPDLILALFSTGMSSNPISGYLSKYIFIPWGLCFLRKILETILNKKNNQIEDLCMKDVAMDTIVWEGRKKNSISQFWNIKHIWRTVREENPDFRKVGSIPDLATNMGHLWSLSSLPQVVFAPRTVLQFSLLTKNEQFELYSQSNPKQLDHHLESTALNIIVFLLVVSLK